nr:MAG TPA: hypothetical protein [Caudoviricetes sp.]
MIFVTTVRGRRIDLDQYNTEIFMRDSYFKRR